MSPGMAKCLLGDKIIPVESHWFQWMTNSGWAATISCEEGPPQVSRSGQSLPGPTGTTQNSSGMPAPHASRSWSFAKHLGGGLGSWFYRVTHWLIKAMWSSMATMGAEPCTPSSLSSALSLNRQLRSQKKKKINILRKRKIIYICLDSQSPIHHTHKQESTDTLLLEAASKINFFLGLQRRKTAPKVPLPKEWGSTPHK